MAVVKVGRATDYDDTDTIRQFVDAILDMDPDIQNLFATASPSRLVVVKPNWIQQAHDYDPDVWVPVITHPNVILALLKSLAQRMNGQGAICVCDAAHTHANFDAIINRGDLVRHIDAIRSKWPDLTLEVLDLRREIWVRKEGVIVKRLANPHDPRGYVQLNLGRDSLFYQHPSEGAYFGADYDTRIVNSHHHGDIHEYLLSGSPMACDLFINVPKMKTHKKTGITCCLKNLVGITGDKDWLPHFAEGTPRVRGDEFPLESWSTTLERRLKKMGQRLALASPDIGGFIFRKARNVGKNVLGDSATTIRAGNWAGNDTCWRMALDLNRCLLYGNRDGSWKPAAQPKRYLAIVDGIIAGDGDGPLAPDPVEAGVLIGGTNPAAVDACVSRLMGFQIEDLPMVQHAFGDHPLPIADAPLHDLYVDDCRTGKTLRLEAVNPVVSGGFKPHFGWPGLKSA